MRRRLFERRRFGALLCALVLAQIFSLPVSAQQQVPIEEMSAGGLLSQASAELAANRYAAAIPYLNGYLDRMQETDDDRVLSLMQTVRLKLGKIYTVLDDPASAAEALEQYTQALPCYKPREAWKLLALNRYEAGLYLQCVEAATNALARPEPKDLPGKTKQIDYEQLTKDEMAGFTARQMKRIEKEVEEAGGEVSADLSGDVPDAEPDYTNDELVLLNITLGKAYSQLKWWEASVAPYKFVIENAVQEDRRGYATMQLVKSLIAMREFDEVQSFIVKLYRTNARYDIRVNMALMSAAAALFNEEQYDSSLMLYRMVIPRQELLAYQEQKMNELRRQNGLPDVAIQISTNELGRIETLFGNKFMELKQTGGDFDEGLPPKPMELVQLEESVGALVSLPPYEEDVIYRVGLLYARSGRPWEAVTALDYVAGQDPDGDRGQKAFAEALMVLVDPLQKYDLVEERGKQFLATYNEGQGPRQVALALTISYQKQALWEKIKELLPVINGFVASKDPAVLQYECELYYMQAVADMVLLDYRGALSGFDRVLINYPGSHRTEDASYWHALAQLFLKNNQEAFEEFEDYLKSWPEGSWLSSVVFHSGIALFGLEEYDRAKERFTRVIESWPDSSVYSDACSLRGDLYASQGELNFAQADYEEAIASAQTPRQDAYAVFQMAAMFELENRYQETLDMIAGYLGRQEDEADVARATFWVGKTKLAQGRTDEAIEAYRKTIIDYGGEVSQDGVDMIIYELVKVIRRLDDAAMEALKNSLQASLEQTENLTLQLRLRTLLASMDGTSLELGRQLIDELDDLAQVPPSVLSVICDASFANKDYSRSQEILDLFLALYEDSDFLRTAFKLRAVGLFEAGEYEEARQIANEAQAQYGTEPDVAWTQILKGRIDLEIGNLDMAREEFRSVLGVRDWRGEPYAEANFYLGALEEKAGSWVSAFGWYQRTYFQYKGYANGYWAAEAYLASARCLEKMNRPNDVRNTYRAMLFDKYVNTLPQAETARQALGADEVQEIYTMLVEGIQTNVTVKIDTEAAE